MSTHTPGPWRIGDAGNTVFGPKDSSKVSPEIIARLNRTMRKQANARLIAAAPDLLVACQALLESEESTLGDGGSILGGDYRIMLQEAIANAIGQ